MLRLSPILLGTFDKALSAVSPKPILGYYVEFHHQDDNQLALQDDQGVADVDVYVEI